MITDLDKIKTLAEENEDENYNFRRFLKGCKPDRIDNIVHRLYNEISSQIDCAECRNCCKLTNPVFEEYELENAADHLNITREDFVDKYKIEKQNFDYIIKGDCCPFLKDQECILEDNKPVGCRDYPFLHKDHFIGRTLNVIQNASICPIVYNVYEELKAEVWY